MWDIKNKTPGLAWVDRVWLGHCTGWSFDKPGPVQPQGPASIRRADPGLITMVFIRYNFFYLHFGPISFKCVTFAPTSFSSYN